MSDLLCPQCETRGRKVKPVTIENLALPKILANLDSTAGFAYCPAPNCDVVWFHTRTGVTLGTADCQVRVGMKETESPRPICYCFGHTAEDIEVEIQDKGQTGIPGSIAALCRQGLDRCEETNPQGSCCLGNINQVVKASTTAELGSPAPNLETGNCCLPDSGVCDLD